MSDQVPVLRDTLFDFSQNVIGLPGLISINADITPAQILAGKAIPGIGQPTILITDLGAGLHEFETRTLFASNFTPAGVPVNVLDDTPTVALSLSVPAAGLWFFTGNINVDGGIAGTTVLRHFLLNGASQIGESTQESVPAGTVTTLSSSVISILLQLIGGETITLNIHQKSAAASLNWNAVINGIRLGA